MPVFFVRNLENVEAKHVDFPWHPFAFSAFSPLTCWQPSGKKAVGRSIRKGGAAQETGAYTGGEDALLSLVAMYYRTWNVLLIIVL